MKSLTFKTMKGRRKNEMEKKILSLKYLLEDLLTSKFWSGSLQIWSEVDSQALISIKTPTWRSDSIESWKVFCIINQGVAGQVDLLEDFLSLGKGQRSVLQDLEALLVKRSHQWPEFLNCAAFSEALLGLLNGLYKVVDVLVEVRLNDLVVLDDLVALVLH